MSAFDIFTLTFGAFKNSADQLLAVFRGTRAGTLEQRRYIRAFLVPVHQYFYSPSSLIYITLLLLELQATARDYFTSQVV